MLELGNHKEKEMVREIKKPSIETRNTWLFTPFNDSKFNYINPLQWLICEGWNI